ncbi:hypothetical protein M3J43_24920, partial [Escherichia coli]|nr:hypothetical protein [Escherichia coli]
MIPFWCLMPKGEKIKGQSNKWISYHLRNFENRDFENSRIEFLFCQKLLLSLIVSIFKSWLLVGRSVDYGKKGEFLKSVVKFFGKPLFMSLQV